MTDPVSIDAVVELIGAMNGPSPDFIMRNGGWLITVIGLFSACVGGVLTYFLKSRCSEIKCLCFSCKRQPLDIVEGDVEGDVEVTVQDS
jgi:hypothetical protein